MFSISVPSASNVASAGGLSACAVSQSLSSKPNSFALGTMVKVPPVSRKCFTTFDGGRMIAFACPRSRRRSARLRSCLEDDLSGQARRIEHQIETIAPSVPSSSSESLTSSTRSANAPPINIEDIVSTRRQYDVQLHLDADFTGRCENTTKIVGDFVEVDLAVFYCWPVEPAASFRSSFNRRGCRR